MRFASSLIVAAALTLAVHIVRADDCACSGCATPAACGGCTPPCSPQTVKRTILVPTMVTEERNVSEVQCVAETRTRNYTVCEMVPVSKTVQRCYTTMVPETHTRTETYCVSVPKTREVTETYQIQVPTTKTGGKAIYGLRAGLDRSAANVYRHGPVLGDSTRHALRATLRASPADLYPLCG